MFLQLKEERYLQLNSQLNHFKHKKKKKIKTNSNVLYLLSSALSGTGSQGQESQTLPDLLPQESYRAWLG